MELILVVVCVMVLALTLRAENIPINSTACYDRVGCFPIGSPYNENRLIVVAPQSPNLVKTKFLLYTRQNQHEEQVLDARRPHHFNADWNKFKPDSPLKFIVHGFLNNVYLNTWQREMKDALLRHGDYNVVLVDWHCGNQAPYTQATANTRLVGAQIADLINTLRTRVNYSVEDVHIIGHSLGAHVSGYAGERVEGMGRITGLDPAGPHFYYTHPRVRLDETDAQFVDVIHTDAQIILQAGLGGLQRMGHADFYPNHGHDQPGCDKSPILENNDGGFVFGIEEIAACSHHRAVRFFQESINSPCPFRAYPCATAEERTYNNCTSCGEEGCSRMGFYADQLKPSIPTKYFLRTASESPFCAYHMSIQILLTPKDSVESERGNLRIQIFGSEQNSDWIELNTDPILFEMGKAYSFLASTPFNLGTLRSVTLSWKHESNLLSPWEWNPLNFREPAIYVDKIIIKQEEAMTLSSFCVDGLRLETDHLEQIDDHCDDV